MSGDALTAGAVQTRIRQLADWYWGAMDDEHRDRQALLEGLIGELRHLAGPAPKTAKVQLFKPSGKWYTDEEWGIPLGAIGPWDMARATSFRRIDGGPVLVEAQEPWGYPFLLVGA